MVRRKRIEDHSEF